MKCYVCDQDLSENEFYIDPTQSRGYRYSCKKCDSEQAKNYYDKNYNKIKAKHYEWVANHKIEYDIYKKNYEKEYIKRPEVKARQKIAHKKWASSPKGRISCRIRCSRRRGRERGLVNDLTYAQVIELLKEQTNKCKNCNKPFINGNFELDHIIPVSLSKPGDPGLTKSNTQLLCRSCNAAKGNK